MNDNSTWNAVKDVLKRRTPKWEDGKLPGVHLDVTRPDTCRIVFDCGSVEISHADVDLSDVHGSVRTFIERKIGLRFLTEGGQFGTLHECRNMAYKIAAKCARNGQFLIWLTIGS